MKILFLHGWHGIVGGVKPTFLIIDANASRVRVIDALTQDKFIHGFRFMIVPRRRKWWRRRHLAWYGFRTKQSYPDFVTVQLE